MQQPVAQSTSEVPNGPLQLHVFPGPTCAGSLYTDDGVTFNYTRGEFLHETYSCQLSEHGLSTRIARHEGLYIWAGRQDKTAARVRQIISANFHSGRNGLPGNDDSGAMSSWYAFGMIELFPNGGQDVYLIGSPQFPEVKFHLAGDKTFVIVAKGTSPTNIYITAAESSMAATRGDHRRRSACTHHGA